MSSSGEKPRLDICIATIAAMGAVNEGNPTPGQIVHRLYTTRETFSGEANPAATELRR